MNAFLGERNVGKRPLDKKRALPETVEAIHAKNLSFSYAKASEEALSGIDLIIPKNQTVAIVGPSGSGKSSFLDLLLRLYEPSQGTFFFDEINYKELDIASLRSHFAIVRQEPFFFYGTIEENLRWENKQIPLSTLKEVCALVGADAFIEKLPQKYKTVLGEKAEGLSGREKQRLAIARALLKNPKVLLLDEATSHLDSASEEVVKECLKNLQGRLTVLVIAHRLSTITKADQIYVFSHGKLVEKGTHESLLALSGNYHHLWSLQNGALDSAIS